MSFEVHRKTWGYGSQQCILRERGFAEAKRLCYSRVGRANTAARGGRTLRAGGAFRGVLRHVQRSPERAYDAHDARRALGKKEHRTYLEHIYFEEDLEAQRRMVQSRFPVALLSEVTDGKLERALRCREITSPIGLGYELLSVCSVGQEQWGGITLIRERGRPDFEAREVTLLHRIIPHLSSGLKAAVLAKQASAEPEGESAPGVLVLDDQGGWSNTRRPPNDGLGISPISEPDGWRARGSRLRCGWW